MKEEKDSKSKLLAFEGVGFIFKVCWRYNRWYIFLLLFEQIVSIAATFIPMILSKNILNAVFEEKSFERGAYFLALLVGAILVTGFLQTVLQAKELVAKTIVFKFFRLDLSERIMSVRYERTETADFLNLKSKADEFISTGGAGFGVMLERAFGITGTVISMVLYAVILSEISTLLIVLTAVLTAVSILISYKLNHKTIEINIEKASQERRASYFTLLTQHFKYGKEIRSNDCSDWVSSRYEGQLNILQRFYERLASYSIKYGLLTLLVSLVQRVVTYLYLISRAFSVGMEVGNFMLYLSSVEGFAAGLGGLVGGIAQIYQYNEYYKAFKEYYYISDEDAIPEDEAIPMPDVSGEMTIAFNDVSFHYPNAEYYAISHVNCEIKKGDIVSIVGENGAGKSTFIKLLLRLYEPTEGKITINGVDVSRISRSEYAKHFASVFQDYQLMAFSLRDNITLGEGGDQPDEERVDEALRFVNITDKVDSLEKGKDTMIYRDFDPNGYTPSGGEAQRLAMARAVFRKSDVLILDEPTASLDPNIEYELNQQIRKNFYGKKTVINVSHRLQSVRSSNRIFVFRGGQLVESGDHESLFARPTLYRRMFERQASAFMDIKPEEDQTGSK